MGSCRGAKEEARRGETVRVIYMEKRLGNCLKDFLNDIKHDGV